MRKDGQRLHQECERTTSSNRKQHAASACRGEGVRSFRRSGMASACIRCASSDHQQRSPAATTNSNSSLRGCVEKLRTHLGVGAKGQRVHGRSQLHQLPQRQGLGRGRSRGAPAARPRRRGARPLCKAEGLAVARGVHVDDARGGRCEGCKGQAHQGGRTEETGHRVKRTQPWGSGQSLPPPPPSLTGDRLAAGPLLFTTYRPTKPTHTKPKWVPDCW